MSKHANPLAFPSVEPNADGSPYHYNAGMSLRDWFAGQALVGIMSRDFEVSHDKCAVLADIAYTFADAMLERRAKTEGQQ